jgi:membrane fusion protein, multidrug efflux system
MKYLNIKFSFFFFLQLLVLASCKNNEKLNSDEDLKKKTVINQLEVMTDMVEDVIFKKQVISNGIIEARNRSEMRFRQTDNILSINVKNGDLVEKGQIIACLDQNYIFNLNEQAKREFDVAKDKLSLEKINYNFTHTPDSLIPQHILSIIKNRSGYNEAEARLKNKQIMLDQTNLRAGFKGRVANINTKEGNFINSSEVFCVLFSHEELDLIFHILESELPFISLKQIVRTHTYGNNQKQFIGEIIEINPVVDSNGLIRIKAKINNPSLELFDGMNMKIIIEQPLLNVISIPKESVVLRSNKEVVFTIKNGKSKWNYVNIIDQNMRYYAVKQGGVKVGDTIIVSNHANLSHDVKVIHNFIHNRQDKIIQP